MAFYRKRTINGRQYLYREERWREGKKVRSRSKCLGALSAVVSGAVGSPLLLVPALPFMIAYDLISGNRVERLEAQLANGRAKGGRAGAWAAQKFDQSDRERIFHQITGRMLSPFEHRSMMYQVGHPAPTYRANEAYSALRATNERQINNYWSKASQEVDRAQKANEQYMAEQEAAPTAPEAPAAAQGEGGGGKGAK
jgi:hypothetical protein